MGRTVEAAAPCRWVDHACKALDYWVHGVPTAVRRMPAENGERTGSLCAGGCHALGSIKGREAIQRAWGDAKAGADLRHAWWRWGRGQVEWQPALAHLPQHGQGSAHPVHAEQAQDVFQGHRADRACQSKGACVLYASSSALSRLLTAKCLTLTAQSMLCRMPRAHCSMHYREAFTRSSCMQTDPASLGYGEGGSIPALDFMTDPPPQEEAGRAGAGASALPLPQGASFQRNTYRGPTANFATVQEEGDMSEEFATQSQQGGSSSGDQGSGSNHPNGEGPAGGAAQRRNSSGPALAPSPKKSTGGTPEAGAGNAAPVSSGDRKSPVGGLVNPLYTLRTSLGQTSSDDHAVSPATRVMRDMNMAWPAQGPRDLEAGGVAPQAEGAQAEPGQQDNSGYPRLQAQPASGQQQLQGGLVGATGREKKRNSSVSFHATEPPLSGRDSQTGHIKPSSSSAVPGPDDHGYDEDVGEEDEKAHALQVANER